MNKQRWLRLVSAALLLTIILAGAVMVQQSRPTNTEVVLTKMVLPPAEVVVIQTHTQAGLSPLIQSVPITQTEPEASEHLSPMLECLTVAVPPQPIANQVVIHFKPETSPEAYTAYVQSFSGTIHQEIDALQTVVVSVPMKAVDLDWLDS